MDKKQDESSHPQEQVGTSPANHEKDTPAKKGSPSLIGDTSKDMLPKMSERSVVVLGGSLAKRLHDKETEFETATKQMLPTMSEPLQTSTTSEEPQEKEQAKPEASTQKQAILALGSNAEKLKEKQIRQAASLTFALPGKTNRQEQVNQALHDAASTLEKKTFLKGQETEAPKGSLELHAESAPIRAKSQAVKKIQKTKTNNITEWNQVDTTEESPSVQPGAVSVQTLVSAMNTTSPPTLEAPLHDMEEGNVDTAMHKVTEATLVDPMEREEEAQRIRQETLQKVKENAAMAQVVDVTDERKRRINMIICLVCVLALLITVAVTTTVALVNDDGPVIIHVVPTRSEAVTDAVTQEFGAENLDDENSPQYIAIDWMAVNDTLLEFPLETEAERRAFRQRYIMCVLAFATGIDTWVRQTNWLEPVDECTWSGLTCDDNGELLAINTPNRNLTGTLPSELGSLSMLRFMFVYDNPGLQSSIPSELGNAASLELFYAQDCSLTGTLPSSLEGLSSLEKLVLARNNLHGNLPVEMTRMLNVEELDLSYNNFTGVILPKFWHMQKMQVLLLNDNAFTGSLSPNFGDLALLERLEIQNNYLTGDLPTQLGNLRSLQTLRSFGNAINATNVPDQVCHLRRDAPDVGLQILEMNCVEPCRCCTPCL